MCKTSQKSYTEFQESCFNSIWETLNRNWKLVHQLPYMHLSRWAWSKGVKNVKHSCALTKISEKIQLATLAILWLKSGQGYQKWCSNVQVNYCYHHAKLLTNSQRKINVCHLQHHIQVNTHNYVERIKTTKLGTNEDTHTQIIITNETN